MNTNPPFGRPRPDRVDGRLFLTDDNIDRGTLAVISAARRLESRMRTLAKSEGVSSAQLPILLELAHAPGIDVTELRQRLGGTTPTIARLLGELDKLELIERPRKTDDGRRRALALSEKGQALMAKALSGTRKDMANVYRNAGEPAVSGALDLLQAVSELTHTEEQT